MTHSPGRPDTATARTSTGTTNATTTTRPPRPRPARARAGASAVARGTTAAAIAVAGLFAAPPGARAQQVQVVADGREASMNQLSAEEVADGWRLLFDGETTAGWRGFRADAVPDGWRVVDGALTRVAPGGDIITTDRFADFELTLEWKVEPGGNSGIMYRVTEAADRTYKTGPEMQVLDDARHPDGGSPLTSAGALYGLYPAADGVAKPAGEWNRVRIVLRGDHVEHWLNGTRVVETTIGSPDWRRRVRESKFVEWPGFARARRGHVALQDHGDVVAYRNIKIRPLNERP